MCNCFFFICPTAITITLKPQLSTNGIITETASTAAAATTTPLILFNLPETHPNLLQQDIFKNGRHSCCLIHNSKTLPIKVVHEAK